MQEQWLLPGLASVRNTCPEWLFDLLYKLNEDDRMHVLMVPWRSWYVRHEIGHHKLPPSIEASYRFLISYAESLRCINHFPTTDIIKGKMVLPPTRYSSIMIKPPPQCAAAVQWSAPPAGRVKLNVDGSFVDGGLAGAVMILRDSGGNIVFSACCSIFALLWAAPGRAVGVPGGFKPCSTMVYLPGGYRDGLHGCGQVDQFVHC